MYLKFHTQLGFPAIARLLCPELTEDKLEWDSENVYEWMYVNLPQLDFSLNLSREHGCACIDFDMLEQPPDNQKALKHDVRPGPVYVFGWDGDTSNYVDQLPAYVAAFIANRLSVEVSVFNRPINIDIPDGQPLEVVKPNCKSG